MRLLYKIPYWATDIKRRMVELLEHVVGTNQTRVVKKFLKTWTRKVGRAKLIWLEYIENGLRESKEKIRRRKVNNGEKLTFVPRFLEDHRAKKYVYSGQAKNEMSGWRLCPPTAPPTLPNLPISPPATPATRHVNKKGKGRRYK
jgi:hypothetical protein